MDNEKSFWLHRCHFTPLFINTNCKQSGTPVLLTNEEVNALRGIDSGFIFALPDGFLVDEDTTKDYEEYIHLLNSFGITKEEFLKRLDTNYDQQANRFFQNGLYTIYNSLERTATQHSEKKLDKILSLDNFGFNHSRNLNFNTALILEIPTKCFDFIGQQQLYENSDNPFEVLTEYLGYQKTSKVVPMQYIKRIVVHYGKTSFEIDNPNFDLEYEPRSTGIGLELFDGYTLNHLSDFVRSSTDENSIKSYIIELKEKATQEEYLSRLEKIYNCCKYNTHLQSLLPYIDKELDGFRTPYQKSYIALENCDFQNCSLEDLENIVLDFLHHSRLDFRNTLSIDTLHRNGISLIREAISYLRMSDKFNDIVCETENRQNIIAISDYIWKYYETFTLYDNVPKNVFFSMYSGITEEQIDQIRLQYEKMNTSFAELATSQDQDLSKDITVFWNNYSNGPLSLDNASQIKQEQPLAFASDTIPVQFSVRDLGEASYDSPTDLCVEATTVVTNIMQRSYGNEYAN